MPGFRSHYVFGIESRNSLKKFNTKQSLAVWDMIRSYPSVFALGLQGPDIFFYNPLSYIHGRNIGERMHHEKALPFIMHLIDICGTISDVRLRGIAHAYTAGFIGHYTLDTICHPYIHYRACKDISDHTNAGFYDHMLLESDIDASLTAHFLGMKPSEFHPSFTIRTNHEESFFTAALIQRAIELTFPGSLVLTPEVTSAIKSIRLVYDLMEDPHMWKKKLLRSLESLVLRHAQFSAMILDDGHQTYPDPCNLSHHLWKNPWETGITSTDSFYDLFHKARELYLKRLDLLYCLFNCEFGSRDYFSYITSLKSSLGNLSYDSGLPL